MGPCISKAEIHVVCEQRCEEFERPNYGHTPLAFGYH